jgi:alpha-tubulin suppressor-like RCC1 family protein
VHSTMFRTAGRQFLRQSSRHKRLVFQTVVAVGGATYLLQNTPVLQNDGVLLSDVASPSTTRKRVSPAFDRNVEALQAYLWGSNAPSASTLSDSADDSGRIPTIANYLSGFAFRDVVTFEGGTIAVDAVGDVYEWGLDTAQPPKCILKGKVSTRLVGAKCQSQLEGRRISNKWRCRRQHRLHYPSRGTSSTFLFLGLRQKNVPHPHGPHICPPSLFPRGHRVSF